ncbi:MAG: 6-phosphogluconate dehydrogenase [Saprospiraceae bacterium]|jgi:6-phosphogluconate dehydrogenase
MAKAIYDFGLIGLGTMGKNLLMNISDHGYEVAGYDKDLSKVQSLKDETGDIYGAETIEDFVASLEKPRKLMMLVPAGKIVDYVITDLMPLLDRGDIIMDGGNSFFKDTERRQKELKGTGIHYLGIGISGGAEGARRGPSMMPGGNRTAYNKVKPILESVAAKIGKQPCVTYLGEGSVGNYVKMVHNGIEYGLMQILAEAYDVMNRGLGMSNAEIHETFTDWNEKELQSFLVEITAKIFAVKDKESGKEVIDLILDKGKQKGTGKWTSQDALNVGEPIPTIDLAVIARAISAFKTERVAASEILKGPENQMIKKEKKTYMRRLKNATIFSFLVTYAQGMSLLQSASEEYKYNLDLEGVAKIWRGGCIIRAKMLEDFRKAYKKDAKLTNLLVDSGIAKKVNKTQKDTRTVIMDAVKVGVPLPCIGACLAYFDSYRAARLPMNLVQAQRDFFGSHTYERLDREGVFHTEWEG